MADISYVKSQLSAFESEQRVALTRVFEHVLKATLRIGPERAENVALQPYETRTHTTADQEFQIEHGLGRVPRVLLAGLKLDTANLEIVPLKVTRAATSRFLYLSSAETDVPIVVWVD